MISTRLPSEAELIELENWAIKLRERFDRAWSDWNDDDMDLDKWEKRYPELPLYPHSRVRLYENLRALLDLARTVKNQEK